MLMHQALVNQEVHSTLVTDQTMYSIAPIIQWEACLIIQTAHLQKSVGYMSSGNIKATALIR